MSEQPVFSEKLLSQLDGAAPAPLTAKRCLRLAPHGSVSCPAAFLCSDGQVYWLKTKERIPGSLTAELVAGRLGALTALSPATAIVTVPAAALPPDPDMQRFLGNSVGVRDVPGAVNVRELQFAAAAGTAPDSLEIDIRSWLETVAFQTWLGVRDQQVLIVLSSGLVRPVDHEEYAAAEPESPIMPRPVVDPIFSVPPPKDPRPLAGAVKRIEAVSDADLLKCVAARPGSLPMLALPAERLRIAECLAARRDRLRGVLEGWVKS